MESAIEGGACLTDDVGRTRILDICRDGRQKCARLAASETKNKLEKEMAEVTQGEVAWQQEVAANGILLLHVPRGKVPLSLWD